MKKRFDPQDFHLSPLKKITKFIRKKKTGFAVLGALSLIWFLIRVIPKPSRAMYPCQRLAFPLATAFITWLSGFTLAYLSFREAKKFLISSKIWIAGPFLLAAFLFFPFSRFLTTPDDAFASEFPVRSIEVLAEPAFHISPFDSVIEPVSTVSIIRSTKANASEISYEDIRTMIREAVEKAGGLGDIIQNGDVVVLKPNLVVTFLESPSARFLLPEVNGITTDWRIVKATVELVRELNPDGKVYIAEGSADESTRTNFSRMYYTHERIPGVDAFIAFEESGAWEEWNSQGLVSVTLPSGTGLYSDNLKPNRSPEFYLNKIYYEADAIICLPVLKNHKDAGITCAVKNVGIGATPQNIYGGAPGTNARWLNQRINHNWDNLHRWIHDFYLCRPVDFVIIDGLQGITDGPVGGWLGLESIWQNMRMVLASKDALAVDAISALIMGFDPEKVPHLLYLARDTVGCINPAYIGVEGKQVHEVRKTFAFTSSGVDGQRSRNYDFSPPSFSVNHYSIFPDSIYIGLDAGEDVVKVEFSVDGILLRPVYIRSFGNIILHTGKEITDPKQVKIYAYDRFLNCSFMYLDGSPVGIGEATTRKTFRIYPLPVTDLMKIESFEMQDGKIHAFLYDLNGRIVMQPLSIVYGYNEVDLSTLAPGTYVLVLKNNGSTESIKFVKK